MENIFFIAAGLVLGYCVIKYGMMIFKYLLLLFVAQGGGLSHKWSKEEFDNYMKRK